MIKIVIKLEAFKLMVFDNMQECQGVQFERVKIYFAWIFCEALVMNTCSIWRNLILKYQIHQSTLVCILKEEYFNPLFSEFCGLRSTNSSKLVVSVVLDVPKPFKTN